MTFPKCRLRLYLVAASVGLTALASAATADTTAGRTTDPGASTSFDLMALPRAEQTGLGALSTIPLKELVAPPVISGNRGSGKQAVAFNDAWLAAQPKARGDKEFMCLATALYFEARGETPKGQAAVAEVILNRTESPEFPGSICSVVNQGSSKGCQFSFTCDGYKDSIREPEAWERAAKIARAMIDGAPRELTDGATHFHTPAVRPSWSRRFAKTASIGRHIFYRAPIRTAMN